MKWYRHVMALELRKILAYRSDFWVTFLGQTILQLVIARALWSSIFESQNAEVMNGYSLEMITLYALIVPIGTKILQGENFGFLSREIYDGTFSKYLLYPLSPFVYKTLTYLTYSLFYSVQLVLIFSLFRFFFATTPLGIEGLMNLGTGWMLFLLGAVIYMLMAMAIELLALYVDNIWSLLVMLRFFNGFFGGAMIPLAFFPEWATGILKFTPFPYLVSLPVRTILGFTSAQEVSQGIMILFCWMAFFMLVVKLMWSRGQKSYTGVGV